MTQAPVEGAAPRDDGILITWRETSRPAKALLLGVLVNRLAGFIQIFLVLFLTHQGFSSVEAGFALGVYGAGAVGGTLIGGIASDRLSPRSATLLSMLGSAILIAAILYLRVYPLLLVALFLVSTVGQLYRPATQVLITELTPPRRLVMVTAMYRLALNLGTTLTPLIGAALLAVSYNLLFWAEALAALAYAGIAMVALPRHRDAGGQRSPSQARARPPRSGYRVMIADRRYLVFLGAVLLTSAVYCQYTASLPLAIARSGLSLWWYGAVVSFNGFIVITCELLMTRVVQRWPLRLTVLAGFGLVAIGYSVYAIAIVPIVLIIGTFIWTLSEIIGAPTVFAYPGMAAPEHLRGRYFGAMQSSFGLGASIGPVLGVYLLTTAGQWVWVWAAVVALVATVAGQIGMRTPAHRSAMTGL